MKKVIKRNQIMITALAVMIAVAGYLNFAGTKIGEEEMLDVNSDSTLEEKTALLDLSEEDLLSDIDSLDADVLEAENYLDEDMEVAAGGISILSDEIDEGMAEAAIDTADEASAAASDPAEVLTGAENNIDAEVQNGETPGEAVYTSSSGISALSGAKLLKEQTRAKSKEAMLDIINNSNISESQKQEAVDAMIQLTDIAEKETAAEILLEAKGFNGVVVTITDDTADVVVNASSLTDVQCAQIEDIVSRKTGVAPENIIISPMK